MLNGQCFVHESSALMFSTGTKKWTKRNKTWQEQISAGGMRQLFIYNAK